MYILKESATKETKLLSLLAPSFIPATFPLAVTSRVYKAPTLPSTVAIVDWLVVILEVLPSILDWSEETAEALVDASVDMAVAFCDMLEVCPFTVASKVVTDEASALPLTALVT